jgi:hypothetical protein
LAQRRVRAAKKLRCGRSTGEPRFGSCAAEFARISCIRLLRAWTGRPARGKRFLAGIIGWATLLLIGAAPARAYDKLECVRAHERAQELQRTGDLRARQEQLAICASTTCPELVRDDCRAWSSGGQAASRNVEAPAGGGTDSTRLAPAAPGEPQTPALGTGPSSQEAGTPGQEVGGLPVERVERVERVESDQHGGQPRAEASSQQQGTSGGNRVGWSAAGAGARSGTASDALGRESPLLARSRLEPRTWAAPLLLGSVAGLALVAGAYLGLSGRSSASDLRETCAPACRPSEVSTVRTRLVIADLTMLTGAFCAGATAWLLWDRSASHASLSSSSSTGVPSSGRAASASADGFTASVSSNAFRLHYAGHF